MDKEQEKLGDIFDKHIEFEFDKEDVDATMTTMTEDPYVHHVPTLAGGLGYTGVYNSIKIILSEKCQKIGKLLMFRVQLEKIRLWINS